MNKGLIFQVDIPVLSRSKKPYYLETDASNYALGAILYQRNEKQEKEIITLASRTRKVHDRKRTLSNCLGIKKVQNIPARS